MPLSRFEPLLSHKTSRDAARRDRIFTPSSFYHRKYSSISRFDRPLRWSTYSSSPCRCSGRYKQLLWVPGVTTGSCTCPSWCICKKDSSSRDQGKTGGHALHSSCCHLFCCDLFCAGNHHPSCFCCPILRPKSSPIKSISSNAKKTSKTPNLCDCWRKIVGCCSCPAKDILYKCPSRDPPNQHQCHCCAGYKLNHVPVKPSCCCSGRGCPLCCRRIADIGVHLKQPCCCSGKGCTYCLKRQAESITKALQSSSWLDRPFSGPDVNVGCLLCHCGCDTFCLSTSLGEKRVLPSPGGKRCICCTCKSSLKLSLSSGLEEICVCPPWSDCKAKKKPSMADRSSDKCPCCQFPLSGVIKPSAQAPISPIACATGATNETFKSKLEDEFSCPHWCTCKGEHKELRQAATGRHQPVHFRETDLKLEPIDLDDDFEDCPFLRNDGKSGKYDLDSDSDDSFRTCAWLRKSPLDLDDSDSDVLSIIDSDDDVIKTSDSDSDLDLDCFGKSRFSPIRTGSKAREVKFLCSRPTINLRFS